MEANFLPLYIDMAPYNVDVPNKIGTGRFVLESALNDASTPVGSIIPFYDFNGVAQFDTNIWNYCDGSVINSPGSILDGQTLPDLSGRYICGFGTDGGGNIDTAPWDVAPVGNAGSTVNLQHSHTVNAHSHTVNNHSHSISNDGQHEHGARTNGMSTTANELYTGTYRLLYNAVWQDADNVNGWIDSNSLEGGGNPQGHHDHVISADGTHDHSGTTGNSSPGTNNASPGTDNQLSNAQDIRPSTIRVRFIMKIN